MQVKTHIRKIIFLCLFLSFNSSAKWEYLSQNNGVTQYVDMSSRKFNGHNVVIQEYLNFPPDHPTASLGLLSMQNEFEYDCKNKITRLRYQVIYSGSHLSGDVIASGISQKENQWRPLSNSSIGESNLKVICYSKK